MKKIMFISGICATLLVAANASPSPCTGIDRKIDDTRKAELAAPIAAQLKTDHLTVLGFMGLKNWSIVYVETSDSDPPFLFFNSDPGKTHYVTLWSGAARIDEGKAINRWALENAPGIPRKLATCFAWSVTGVESRN